MRERLGNILGFYAKVLALCTFGFALLACISGVSLANAQATFVGSASGNSASSAVTTHVITMPTGALPGDMVVVAFSVTYPATVDNFSVSSGNNWNLYEVGSSSSVSTVIYWKILDGTGDNLTITTSAVRYSSHVSYLISGASGISGKVTKVTSNTTNSNPPNYAHGTGARDILWLTIRSGFTANQATVSPTGYSTLVSTAGSGSFANTTAIAHKSTTASTSEDPGTWTSPAHPSNAWTIAVFEDIAVKTVVEEAATFANTGSVAWGTPSNAQTENDTATIAVNVDGASTGVLSVTDFGFNLPTDTVVEGVRVFIKRNMESGGGPGTILDQSIRLIISGAAAGSNYAETSNAWPYGASGSGYIFANYGDGADSWGNSLTPAIINATNFGVAIQALEDDADPRDARIDYVKMQVRYFVSYGHRFNFRSTLGHVTDPIGDTHVLGETSSQSRDDVTFQWNVCADCSRDRSGYGSLVRFGGVNKRSNDGTQNTWTLTLPAAGYYSIHAAFGDADNSGSITYAEMYDDSTLITTLNLAASGGANTYRDATGVVRDAADWEDDNVPVIHNFSSTTFKLVIGSPTNIGGETRISHLWLQPYYPPPLPDYIPMTLNQDLNTNLDTGLNTE
jgi:hypothetical protein